MEELARLARSFGLARIAAIVGVTAGVAAALVFVTARIGEASYAVLYANLDLAQGQDVVERLEADAIPYRTRESAGRLSVLVPREEATRLRLRLAGDGFVARGGVGYEIFDQTDALGQTSFQQSINRLRALEGELARTITTIEGVRSARVHLVLPERELFTRDRRPATASIVVDAPSGLEPRSVKAIVNLAASAVPELAPGGVTVLDASGALLTAARDDETAGVEERSANTEARLRRTVEDMLGRIVGAQNVRVQIAADLDFSRVTEQAEIIDPDSQTVLSSSTVEESTDETDPAGARGVSIANALPGAAVVDPAGAAAATNAMRRTEETTNYEISRTVRNEVREVGRVKRLSVAVALNAGAQPRPDEEMARLAALVRSAVGFDASRGDQMELVETRFQDMPAAPEAGTSAVAPVGARFEMSRLAEAGALAAVAVALIVFVLRPLLSPQGARAAPPSTNAALAPPEAADDDVRIDLSRVEGRVKASSVSKVVDVVRGHTDESAALLKSWIREAS